MRIATGVETVFAGEKYPAKKPQLYSMAKKKTSTSDGLESLRPEPAFFLF